MEKYYVYILSSSKNGTLYIGVTGDLPRRVYEHKQGLVDGFTKKYGIKNLVYAEPYQFVYDALRREKILKSWPRSWKIQLIEEYNLNWEDLNLT